MTEEYPIDQATVGASLEAQFDDIAKYGSTKKVTIKGTGQTLTLVSSCDIPLTNGANAVKCIALQDTKTGDIYVHFRGTGDGYWQENATGAYTGTPSTVQKESETFFNNLMDEQLAKNGGTLPGKVFVSGHSQGGNTAQYVTLHSEYADLIDTTVSLDGPGFSQEMIDQFRTQYGEGFYNRQVQKMYACNGDKDFVSPLGDVHPIPEERTIYIVSQSPKGEDNDFMSYHLASGLLDPDGTLREEGECSEFRKLVGQFAEVVGQLPDDKKETAAMETMRLVEMFMTQNQYMDPLFTQADWNAYKKLLGPVLVTFLAENPDLLMQALTSMGLVDGALGEWINKILDYFNELPLAKREEIVQSLLDMIVIKEDGSGFEWDPSVGKVLKEIILLLPTLMEATSLQDIILILQEAGVWDMVTDFIIEHPIMTLGIVTLGAIGLVVLWPVLRIAIPAVIILAELVDFLYKLTEKLENLAKEIKEFLLAAYQSMKEFVEQFKEWAKEHSPGGQYVQNSPYFKADTGAMSEYVGRLRSVNSRLWNLNLDMKTLIPQLTISSLDDYLLSDFSSNWSVTLERIIVYMDAVVSELEKAEKKAKEIMGG